MGTFADRVNYAVFKAMRVAPVELASAIGGFMARTNVRYFLKNVAVGARRNLKIHRPDASPEEIEATVWRFVDNVGRFMMESAVVHRLQEENRIELVGFDALVAAYGREPLVGITLHLGNWEAMGAALQQVGVKIATFYWPLENPMEFRIIMDVRRQFGFHLLQPDHRGMREALHVLKANGLVNIFGDEALNGWTRAPLFGRPPHDRCNLALAARLARKAGARMLIGYSERLAGCRFRMHIIAPFALPEGANRTVADDVAFLNAKIEPIILANLDSWYYLNDSIAPLE